VYSIFFAGQQKIPRPRQVVKKDANGMVIGPGRNAIVKRFANILALLNKYMPAGQLHFGAIYGSKS